MTKKLGKFMCLVLRHKPDLIGLTLDRNGWAPLPGLLRGLTLHGFDVDADVIQQIVETDEKSRYAFSADGSRIRAQQGHSVKVDLDLPAGRPPAVLFHGTCKRVVDAIYTSGINKMKRHHVHLSSDVETARIVGARHGDPVVFAVDADRMLADGYEFFITGNEVWLTDHVPVEYVRPLWRTDHG